MFSKHSEFDAGVPIGATERFLKELNCRKVNLHSVMLFHNGEMFCEEYAPGFCENFKHRLYSVSKTYVSAAIGVAIGEGYITLESRVADFFADKLPENAHPYLTSLTVRDCLMMASPFDETAYDNEHYDWVLDFFTATPTHRGGTIFHYDTAATLVLDELVHRVTGKPFNEYLYEKVLKYIGYETCPECVETPDGTKWGGSGMLCTAREFAAFALLFRNSGRAEDGTQLIPEWYIKEATSKQIGNNESNKQTSLYGQGYGYQVWRLRNGWGMYGMGNQLAFYYPEQDFLFVCTGDDQGNDYARNYIIDLLDELFLIPLGYHKKEGKAELGSPVPVGEKYSDWQKKVNGKTYKLLPNPLGMKHISFDFGEEECKMKFFAHGKEKAITFGLGKFVEGVFPEEYYSGIRINTPLGRGYRSFAAASWDLPDLLVLKCYAADMYFGVLTANIRFSERGIDLHFTKTAEWFFNEYNGFASGTAIE